MKKELWALVALIASCACAADAGTKAPDKPVASVIPANCGAAKLTEGRSLTKPPDGPKPKRGVAWEDPTFHTCLVRATDHDKDGIDTFSRHDYSRRESFNADNSWFFTNSRDGGWYLYDARTLKLVDNLQGVGGDAEPQWHPTDPDTLYYVQRNGGMELFALDVKKGRSRTVVDWRGKLPFPKAARVWTKSEGSPSRDGRFWAMQIETESFEIVGYGVWDLQNNKLVGSRPEKNRPDHVSMTPSGRWFTSSGDDGTIAWSPDFKTRKVLHKKTEHSDLAIGANGHDYYVSIDYQSNEGYIFMIDVDTGERTDLIRTYINGSACAVHFSGKAYDKPGWVLVSTYNCSGSSQWFNDKVFAMELKKDPRIYQLAMHKSAVKDQYFAEPQATVNRDFTMILFNTNWGVPASTDIDAYMIRLPKGAFP